MSKKALTVGQGQRRALDRRPGLLPHAGQHAQAQDYFNVSPATTSQDEWLRAAGSFWAARRQPGRTQRRRPHDLMIQAARSPNTFYGMIAARQLALSGLALGRSRRSDRRPDQPLQL
jgi:hypothetical protein